MVDADPSATERPCTELSVVAPLYNESQNVPPLVDWILQALAELSGELRGHPGRRRQPGRHLGPDRRAAAAAHPQVHGLRLGRNVGQTAAMMAGFDHARGRVVVSLDGDLQNDPRDIPMLVAKLDEGYDLVCGWRQQRQDKLILRKVPSWVANRIIRRLTGRADHRQRLLAQGLSPRPARPDLALRRAAPVHSRPVGQRRAPASPRCRCGTTPGASARASTASAER